MGCCYNSPFTRFGIGFQSILLAVPFARVVNWSYTAFGVKRTAPSYCTNAPYLARGPNLSEIEHLNRVNDYYS